MNSFTQLEAFLLGALQGITEFLPVSSSAHLILYSYFTNGKSLPLLYNIALHFGTALALLCYFFKDWIKILKEPLQEKKLSWENFQKSLLFKLIISSLPAGILGLLFKEVIEKHLHTPFLVIFPLIFFGILLWLSDKVSPSEQNLKELSLKEAFIIGIGQSFALIPGTSRSASTIIAARLLGLTREASIRFSFLMGTPIIIAGALLHTKELFEHLGEPSLYIGLLSSFFIGLLSIHFFLRFFSKFGFFIFALYRTLLACTLFFIL